MAVRPLDDSVPGRVDGRELAPGEVEFAAVLFGDVLGVDEFSEGGLDFVGAEDEDFGDGDGVEPAFDPAPDCGEEDGRSDDLQEMRG